MDSQKKRKAAQQRERRSSKKRAKAKMEKLEKKRTQEKKRILENRSNATKCAVKLKEEQVHSFWRHSEIHNLINLFEKLEVAVFGVSPKFVFSFVPM